MNEPKPQAQIFSNFSIQSILSALAYLVIFQIVRALINWACVRFLPTNFTFRDEITTLITFGGLTIAWLLALRPGRNDLGLNLSDLSRSAKIGHLVMGVILFLLIGSSGIISPRLLVENLANAIVVPVAEELIFRGWLWNRIEKASSGPWQQPLAWAVTTTLFALWHLGYVDAVMRHTPKDLSLGFIMFTKVLIGGAVGALAGLARLKSKRLYAAVFIHAIWNVFGR